MELSAWITLAVLAVMVVVLYTERVPPGSRRPGCGRGADADRRHHAGAGIRRLQQRGADHRGLPADRGPGGGRGRHHAAHRHAPLPRAPRSSTGILSRLLFPLAGISAFVNNTTLVAMTMPAVIDISARRNLPASRFLMPVSYAAILGGVVTTIGTSTNLTVSGLLAEAGMRPLGLFEPTAVGLPIALVGVAVVILVVPRLLPDRTPVGGALAEGGRDFTVTHVGRAGWGGRRRQCQRGRPAPAAGRVPGRDRARRPVDRAGGPGRAPAGRRPAHLRRPGRQHRRPATRAWSGFSRGPPDRQPGRHRPRLLRSGRRRRRRRGRADAEAGRLPGALRRGRDRHPPRRPAGRRQTRRRAAARWGHAAGPAPTPPSVAAGAIARTSWSSRRCQASRRASRGEPG